MKVTVRITQSFKVAAKPLLKKYHSLSKDLLTLEKEIIETPRLGVSLGQDAYKIRLKISSKGKGRSGGARVTTLIESIVVGFRERISGEDITVNLVTICDKSDVDNISDKELKDLLKSVKHK